MLDYDLAIPNMLMHYFPTGILGLGLTALLASFMSGMAGNVTAFNTVWTYDIYQSYINKERATSTICGWAAWRRSSALLLSIAAAYAATRFNNIMDLLQLVFAFVNAPLFATFLLGMFWKRTSGHGAFFGLVSGTTAAAIHHGLTLPEGASRESKGGWHLRSIHIYPSEMAQNFWTAIWAWSACFVITILISLVTKPREEAELKGLVYSLTERPSEGHLPFYKRPLTLGLSSWLWCCVKLDLLVGRDLGTRYSLTHWRILCSYRADVVWLRLAWGQGDLPAVVGHQCKPGMGHGAADLWVDHGFRGTQNCQVSDLILFL